MASARFILWREQDRRYVFLLIVLAILLASLIGVFFVVFTSARVDGESMVPALMPGDRVLITHGYDTPAIGDVVSARITTEYGDEDVIKRVIALAGDRVEVRGDVAYVNGIESTAAPEPIVWAADPVGDVLTVPVGHVYVLGDNRPLSYDSRFVGPLALPRITGKVVLIFSPVTHWGSVD